MSKGVFDNHVDLIEIASLDKDQITLYVPVAATEEEDRQHAWRAKVTLELPRDLAIEAGLPQKVFELDEYHFQEYAGRQLSELLDLVEHNKKPHFHFNLHF